MDHGPAPIPEPPYARHLDTGHVVAEELAAEVAAPLLATFRATSCHLAGRGAAALLACFQAIDQPGGEVLIPALVCPSVPLACMMGGLIPVFCDVRSSDYTLDPAEAAQRITPNTVAIVAVHLFGHPCDLTALRTLADAHSLLLIEDCAQSLGQFAGDTFLGTVGDVTLLSFDPAKLLPAAGGGALLLRAGAADLAPRVRQAMAAFPDECALDKEQRDELVRRGNAILNTARLDPEHAVRYRDLLGPLSLGIPSQISIPQLEGIRREWETLDRIIPQRELRARRYAALFEDPLLIHPDLPEGSWPLFRYTLRTIHDGMAGVHVIWHLTQALREAGLHASNLYYPAHRLFGERTIRPVAEEVGPRLLNLWLDASASAGAQLAMRRIVQAGVRRREHQRAPVVV